MPRGPRGAGLGMLSFWMLPGLLHLNTLERPRAGAIMGRQSAEHPT